MFIVKSFFAVPVFGTIGLLIAYYIFGQVNGEFIRPEYLLNPPRGFIEGIAYTLLSIEERRANILIGGAIGVFLGFLLAAMPESSSKTVIIREEPEVKKSADDRQNPFEALWVLLGGVTDWLERMFQSLFRFTADELNRLPIGLKKKSLIGITVAGLLGSIAFAVYAYWPPPYRYVEYETPRNGIVTVAAGMRIRKLPGLEEEKIAVIPYGSKLEILAETEGVDSVPNIGTSKWYKVRFNGMEGWGFGKLMSIW